MNDAPDTPDLDLRLRCKGGVWLLTCKALDMDYEGATLDEAAAAMLEATADLVAVLNAAEQHLKTAGKRRLATLRLLHGVIAPLAQQGTN